MKTSPPSGINLVEFSAAFIPFGLLLGFALLWPELTQALDLGRTKATIWVTSILLIPALAIYPFAGMSIKMSNLAHLYWTFAYLSFLVHAGWAVFIVFHGVADTFQQMGTLIAGMNFLLLFWWGFDVLLVWIAGHPQHSVALLHVATRIFVFLVFALTLLVLRASAPVRILGVVFVATTIAALAVRLWTGVRFDEDATTEQPVEAR
jgi:hypothetical protein